MVDCLILEAIFGINFEGFWGVFCKIDSQKENQFYPTIKTKPTMSNKSFPKTVVVCCNTHGEIPIPIPNDSSNNQFMDIDVNINKMTKEIPPGIEQFVKINAVLPGVPNISTLENSEYLTQKVFDEIVNCEINEKNMWYFVNRIQKRLISANRHHHKMLMEQKPSSTDSNAKYLNKFQTFSDQMFKMVHFSQKKPTFVNKIFYRFSPDELKNMENAESVKSAKYFNKIVIMTGKEEETLDIFELLEMIGVHIDEISLYEILELLAGLGATNIAYADLSCGWIRTDARTERRIRKTMMSAQLY